MSIEREMDEVQTWTPETIAQAVSPRADRLDPDAARGERGAGR